MTPASAPAGRLCAVHGGLGLLGGRQLGMQPVQADHGQDAGSRAAVAVLVVVALLMAAALEQGAVLLKFDCCLLR